MMNEKMATAAGDAAHAIAKAGEVRYACLMTKLLEHALATTDQLSPEMQDDLARLILAFTGQASGMYELSEEEFAELDEADRGGFASDEEVAALWTKAGR